MRRYLILTCLMMLVSARAAETTRPNVLFILADDLGWSDTTLFGTTKLYETPNIERLARRGMLFNNAYSASPICSPTRASIMTGLEPARLGITQPNCHLPEAILKAVLEQKPAPQHKAITPESVTRLQTNYVTLAEVLRQAGYVTGHFGKWHLGPDPYSPLQHGFETDLPHWAGPGPAGSYVAPWKFANFQPRQPKEHIEDRMADEAIAFMRTHRDHPFFLNYWAFSVHAPFTAKADLIEPYREKAKLTAPQSCPLYAAMVQSLDEAVGQLLDALDTLKLSDHTIVVFVSDNGGNMYNRVGGVPPTSNAPLRGGKGTIYEGGTRVPCAVVWPGKIAPATRSEALFVTTDFFPTLLAMLDVNPPAGLQFDGVSQWPVLQGKAPVRHEVYSYYPHYTVATGNFPAVSVREGDWKLIRFFCNNADQTDRLELYNLKSDLGETRNLAQAEPEKARQLNALLDQYLRKTAAVIPRPNPHWNPKAGPELQDTKRTRAAHRKAIKDPDPAAAP
ncbi:MAG: sulfatase [Verrucomicrobiota bacterium]